MVWFVIEKLMYSRDQRQAKCNVTESQGTQQGCNHIVPQLFGLQYGKDV